MRPSFIYFLLCRQGSALAPRTHGSTITRSGASEVDFLWMRLVNTATTSRKPWRTTRLSALPGGRARRHGGLLSSHSMVTQIPTPAKTTAKDAIADAEVAGAPSGVVAAHAEMQKLTLIQMLYLSILKLLN